MTDLEDALRIKQEEWEQIISENNGLEEENGHLKEAHEKHRVLIAQLRDELQKQMNEKQ